MKTHYTFLGLVLILVVAFSFTACNRFNNDEQNETNDIGFEDLVVDASFKFQSTSKITFDFTIVPASPNEAPHLIKIYQEDPSSGGKLLNKGMSINSNQYSVTLTIPDRKETVFVENSNADGIYELVELPISSENISYTFNSKNYYSTFPEEKSTIVDPGCGDDCDESLSGTYVDLTLEKNDYCVEDGFALVVSGTLTFEKGATLVVCGTANIANIETIGNQYGTIYISDGGSLTVGGDFNVDGKVKFYNFGTTTISGNTKIEQPTHFRNYSVMNISGNFTNDTEHFENSGTLNLSGNFITEPSSKHYNYATFNISGDLINNSQSKIWNYCKIIVTGDITVNKEIKNYSYIESGEELTINSDGQIINYNGALIDVKHFTLNGQLKGAGGGYSKIDISNNTIINSGAKVLSKMDVCDADEIETNNGDMGPLVVYCETTIPQNSCNPGSDGSTGDTDTDADGVPDVNDDYPTDPERAFDNYYPNSVDFGTFAYEDLWPGKGDYDFNDLVLDFQFHIVTNASNKIVDIITKAHVKAAGASYDNGFGLAIPVAPTNCGSVSGYNHTLNNLDINAKGYENGHQLNTVVILYDAVNSIYGASLFNTIPGGTTVVTDTITVTTYFSTPQIEMGYEPYNPFIYVDQERGKEVHLTDNAPTELATLDYFGTMHDNSNGAQDRWYVTANNLPWAIEIPVSFDYAIEKTDITAAHLKFSAWATSSGVNYTDWYLDKPGYRNTSNIYE